MSTALPLMSTKMSWLMSRNAKQIPDDTVEG
jgi:hypothetical protein